MPDKNISDVNPTKQNHVHFIYLAFGILALVLLFFNPLLDVAVTFNNEVGASALVIWGTVRALLGFMSVIIDADVSGGVVVASTTISPGAALKPIYNMMVRFVDWLFVLMLISNLLALLIPMIAKFSAGILALSLFILAGIGFYNQHLILPAKIRSIARGGVIVGAFFTIVVPASYTLSFWVGDQMTSGTWNNATEVMGSLSTEIETTNSVETSISDEEPLAIPDDAREETEAGDEIGPSQLSILSGALSGISSGITTAAGAAKNSVGSLVGVAGRIKNNTLSLISIFVSAAPNLMNSYMQVLVALLLKLIVLPALILGAAFLVIRRVFSQKYYPVVKDIAVE